MAQKETQGRGWSMSEENYFKANYLPWKDIARYLCFKIQTMLLLQILSLSRKGFAVNESTFPFAVSPFVFENLKHFTNNVVVGEEFYLKVNRECGGR